MILLPGFTAYQLVFHAGQQIPGSAHDDSNDDVRLGYLGITLDRQGELMLAATNWSVQVFDLALRPPDNQTQIGKLIFEYHVSSAFHMILHKPLHTGALCFEIPTFFTESHRPLFKLHASN